MSTTVNTSLDFKPGAKVIRLQLEPLATDPTGGELLAGRIWLNTASGEAKVYDGTATRVVGSGGAVSTDMTVTMSATAATLQAGSGATDTIPLANGTDAGLMSPDQVTRLNEVSSVFGNYIDTVATSAALDALTNANEGTVSISAGDWAILSVDEGGREAGIYIFDGTIWPATPALQVDSVAQASTAVAGITRYSSNAEATAETATDRAVTPSNLPTWFGAHVHTESIGDGTAGPFTVTHNFGTTDVMVQITDANGPVIIEQAFAANTVTITPAAPVSSNAYAVKVLKLA